LPAWHGEEEEEKKKWARPRWALVGCHQLRCAADKKERELAFGPGKKKMDFFLYTLFYFLFLNNFGYLQTL
jgi:hypothetical protein